MATQKNKETFWKNTEDNYKKKIEDLTKEIANKRQEITNLNVKIQSLIPFQNQVSKTFDEKHKLEEKIGKLEEKNLALGSEKKILSDRLVAKDKAIEKLKKEKKAQQEGVEKSQNGQWKNKANGAKKEIQRLNQRIKNQNWLTGALFFLLVVALVDRFVFKKSSMGDGKEWGQPNED